MSQAVNVSNLASFDDLTSQLSLSEQEGNAQLNILSGGDIVQKIILTGISMDALVNGDASSLSQSEQLAAVVNRGVLHLGDNIGTAANDSLIAESGGKVSLVWMAMIRFGVEQEMTYSLAEKVTTYSSG